MIFFSVPGLNTPQNILSTRYPPYIKVVFRDSSVDRCLSSFGSAVTKLSLICFLSRMILCCRVSWKMEPVEDCTNAKNCLRTQPGLRNVQWRCIRSYPSLITQHFLTVCLFLFTVRHDVIPSNYLSMYTSTQWRIQGEGPGGPDPPLPVLDPTVA